MALRVLAGILILICSCTTANPAGQPGEACTADATVADPLLSHEAQARTADEFEVWALIFNTFPMPPFGEPIEMPVGTEVKIVWRVTGNGDLSIKAIGPGDLTIGPDWGPEIHGGSNFNRPGDEWGTGWTFPEIGCWTFEIVRGESRAHLSVEIYEGAGT